MVHFILNTVNISVQQGLDLKMVMTGAKSALENVEKILQSVKILGKVYFLCIIRMHCK